MIYRDYLHAIDRLAKTVDNHLSAISLCLFIVLVSRIVYFMFVSLRFEQWL